MLGLIACNKHICTDYKECEDDNVLVRNVNKGRHNLVHTLNNIRIYYYLDL
jgi:hypothetical protein